MKRDIRKQTFSRPERPSDDEIKMLTNDKTAAPPVREKKEAKASSQTTESSTVKENGAKAEAKNNQQIETPRSERINPFLLSRGQTSDISVEKTGYRLRSEYMDLLKLVKRMKKGHTLEAVLDDALTFYFENSEDGRKAVKQREILEA